MATQITTPTTPLSRPAPRLGGIAVAILAAIAVIAVAVIGVGAWSQARSIGDVTIDSHPYGVGYPIHGGLAGPSRIGPQPTVSGPSGPMPNVDLAGHYGPGYPLSGGLAGPSRPLSAADLAGH